MEWRSRVVQMGPGLLLLVCAGCLLYLQPRQPSLDDDFLAGKSLPAVCRSRCATCGFHMSAGRPCTDACCASSTAPRRRDVRGYLEWEVSQR